MPNIQKHTILLIRSSGFVIRWQRDADLKSANYICL